MTSGRKTASNRVNAKKSTGPKSPEGKARSSQNARKHGILAREVILAGRAALFPHRHDGQAST